MLTLVPRQQKFMREGCPNCEEVLSLRGNSDAVQECTSQVFEGLIALSDAKSSWVARWQRLDGYVSGTYAVKVVGSVGDNYYICFSGHNFAEITKQLPDDVIASLEDAGIRYIP